jgi:hypothetical protein
MTAPPATRAAELATAEAALPATTFAPFSTTEWLGQDEYTEAYTACTAWPTPTDAEPPTTTLPLLPPTLPVLVLGGEFDTWTPPSGVGQVLGQLGGDHRFVELANATHVVGEGDQPCGSTLVQAFVADPAALRTLDVSCAAAVPPIDTVGVYADRVGEQPPLDPGPGDTADVPARRLAAVAVATAGDAVARWDGTDDTHDTGLHGGSVRVHGGGRTLLLHGDTLVPGVPVSGTVRVGATAVTASLRVTGADGSETLTVAWPLGVAGATATVLGTVLGTAGGSVVAGSVPAP